MAASPTVVLDDFVESQNFGTCAILACVRDGFFHYKAGDALSEPVVVCVLVAGGLLEIVCIAALNHFAENGQHLGKIIRSSFTNLHD